LAFSLIGKLARERKEYVVAEKAASTYLVDAMPRGASAVADVRYPKVGGVKGNNFRILQQVDMFACLPL
jgi:hypothetical protein